MRQVAPPVAIRKTKPAMKQSLILMVLLFLVNCGNSRVEVGTDGQNGHARAVVESLITRKQAQLIEAASADFPDNTQLAIALIENGAPTFYGIKRENGTLVPCTNEQSVFEIGSISKVFTASLLAHFVVKQKLALNQPINDPIKLPLRGNVKITFQQLANHTAGLPRMPSNAGPDGFETLNPYKEYDAEKLKHYLSRQLGLIREPGTGFAYSNLGGGLLGYVLSQVHATSYEQLLQTAVFAPYGMSSSTTDRKAIEHRLVRGLGPNGNEVPNWDLNVLVGAGGILSSVSDLSKFALAHFDASDQVLALTRKPTFTIKPGQLEIGLGWFIRKAPGEAGVWHNGGTGGYRSCMFVDPARRKGVIVLSNVSTFHEYAANLDQLCDQLMTTLTGK